MVVALRSDRRRATVPNTAVSKQRTHLYAYLHHVTLSIPGFPKTVPRGLASKFRELQNKASRGARWTAVEACSPRLLRHADSSLRVQAVMIISYN